MRDGRTVLEIPDLQIHPGEIVSVIGPNGAGKTTLLLILSSVLRPTRGRVFYRGSPISYGRAGLQYRRQQAMVFQEPLLFNATVFDNVASGLKLRGLAKDTIRGLVMENLARFGISHLSGRSARNISGGEARRTSLARAMAIQPQVLFLDEPFAALDAPSRETLIEDLGRALKESGITAVIATHDRTEAMRLSTRMAVMDAGRILQIGDPDFIFKHPASEFVAGFVGIENLIPAHVVRAENGRLVVEAGGWQLEAEGRFPAGGTVTLCIRPEHLQIITPSTPGIQHVVNIFRGRIVKKTPLEHVTKVQIDCGFPLIALSTAPMDVTRTWSPGDTVSIAIPPACIHIIAR